MDDEYWKKVDDVEYDISSFGRCRNRNTGRILSERKNTGGYIGYYVRLKDKYVNLKAHRLVAKAFIPLVDGRRIINHINGIRNDNRIKNLEWCTYAENTKHAGELGLIDKKARASKCSKLGLRTWKNNVQNKILFTKEQSSRLKLEIDLRIRTGSTNKLIASQMGLSIGTYNRIKNGTYCPRMSI